jgi:hypothetical protein
MFSFADMRLLFGNFVFAVHVLRNVPAFMHMMARKTITLTSNPSRQPPSPVSQRTAGSRPQTSRIYPFDCAMNLSTKFLLIIHRRTAHLDFFFTAINLTAGLEQRMPVILCPHTRFRQHGRSLTCSADRYKPRPILPHMSTRKCTSSSFHSRIVLLWTGSYVEDCEFLRCRFELVQSSRELPSTEVPSRRFGCPQL